MELGAKIKALRLKNRLTQGELADRCELTKGYISQIENELTSPSIATLKDILQTLGSSLNEFFSDDDDEKVVFGKEDYFVKETEDFNVTWLVPSAQKNVMEAIRIEIEPYKCSENDLPHDGEEFGYVLEGKIRVNLGKRKFVATKGETFYFRADKTHYIQNLTDKKAVVLWLSCPPNF
ncbi:MAG: cupin domain-containing protein [Clostridia bacterium]|nr:cupin domain-containing protein [Clostridia bacterium]